MPPYYSLAVLYLKVPNVLATVPAGFAPWRVRPHIDSSSDQVLKIYLSLTEQKRQQCAYDETKPHKACLFLVLASIEGDWRARNIKFRMSSRGRTRWGPTRHEVKPVSFLATYLSSHYCYLCSGPSIVEVTAKMFRAHHIIGTTISLNTAKH